MKDTALNIETTKKHHAEHDHILVMEDDYLLVFYHPIASDLLIYPKFFEKPTEDKEILGESILVSKDQLDEIVKGLE